MPIAPDDVSLSKAAIIERCIRRIREEYASDPSLAHLTHVDALTLNIERACQAAIDLAMHLIASQRLGMPKSSADAFRLVQSAGMISQPLGKKLRAMTGFRNVAVHEYQEIDKDILHHIAKEGWKDFVEFCQDLGLRIHPQG